MSVNICPGICRVALVSWRKSVNLCQICARAIWLKKYFYFSDGLSMLVATLRIFHRIERTLIDNEQQLY